MVSNHHHHHHHHQQHHQHHHRRDHDRYRHHTCQGHLIHHHPFRPLLYSLSILRVSEESYIYGQDGADRLE